MATQEIAEGDLAVSIRPLGGVDESRGPLDIAETKFNQSFGVYPSPEGGLQRLPGKTIWQSLGEPVYNIVDTQNSKRGIIVETASRILLYSVDELLGLAPAPASLTPVAPIGGFPAPPSPKAIIVNSLPAGTNNTEILSSLSFGARQLSQVIQNDNNSTTGSPIISNFSTANGSFQISPGTYRFKFQTTVGCIAGTVPANTIIKFQSWIRTLGGSNIYPYYSISQVAKADATGSLGNLLDMFVGSDITFASTTTLQLSTYINTSSGPSYALGGQAANLGIFPEIYTAIYIDCIS